MRKIICILILGITTSICVFSQADDICGFWRTLKGNAQIEVYRDQNGTYCGRVVWLRIEKDRPDFNNEDEKLRSRKILGLQILKDLKYDIRRKQWENGKIYDPQTGRTYHCRVKLEHDKGVMVIDGYLPGLKMLSKEHHWIREFKLRT